MIIQDINIEKWIHPVATNGYKFKQSEIYKSLKEYGLNYSQIDDKGVFYFRKENNLIVTSIGKIEEIVWESINQSRTPNKEAILNSFLDSYSIKRNDLLKHILRDHLTTEEKHVLKIQIDPKYAKGTEINGTIKRLIDLQFKKVVDQHGDFNHADLYFRNIENQEFILINHYCKGKNIELQGFDCWKSTYKNEADIGIKKPLSNNYIKLSFQLDKDYDLIHSMKRDS